MCFKTVVVSVVSYTACRTDDVIFMSRYVFVYLSLLLGMLHCCETASNAMSTFD